MSIRFLINSVNNPFVAEEIKTLSETLDAFNDDERTEYRNQNASAIVRYDATKFLIVSGPGTGKSHLFLNKIYHWYQKHPAAKVVVTSFVRKLVADLQNDIDRYKKLTDEQKRKITVSTLHKFARSVEKNKGTTEWPFKPYIRIIGQSWKEVVWTDVLSFFPSLIIENNYKWENFELKLYNDNFSESYEWQNLKEKYYQLCQFYNAAGFADLILRAKDALTENKDLNENNYFIIDEYQDFNLAEEALIEQLTINAKGILIVGDDDQVLYDDLKASKPVLIRNLHKDNSYVKGMLPFCSRCNYHIVKSSDYFIKQQSDSESIEKIYLPLKNNYKEPKVKVIASATASAAVDYIYKFVDDNNAEIEERKRQLETGEKKDAYLLILTPSKKINFYGQDKYQIINLAKKYQPEIRAFSEDYYKLLNYYSLAQNSCNNFAFRKVLLYERVSQELVHELLANAIQNNIDFCDLNEQVIKDIINKCNQIKTIIDKEITLAEKLDKISNLITITDREKLQMDMEAEADEQQRLAKLDHKEEEEAELEEIELKQMGAVELMTIVGSKGLSADHVIIIGFDNINMNYVTKNAFYVAITRARKSLHLLTALKSRGSQKAHHYLDHLPDEHLEFYKYKKSDRKKNLFRNRSSFDNYLSNLRKMSRKK